MITKVNITELEPYIEKSRDAIDINLKIGVIPLSSDVSFELVYKIATGEIIQGIFIGLETDLFDEIDGGFKSGQDEYPLILELLKSNKLAKITAKRPSSIRLSDGVTEAYFK